tara:strand:- start:353 stop:568 length:216 start_codon:yes stop_codon:yes gene_type:complete
MKFILAFSICSAITGFCNNTATIQTQYNTWSECVNGGATLITNFTDTFEEKANKEKLYVTYFCNEVDNEKI